MELQKNSPYQLKPFFSGVVPLLTMSLLFLHGLALATDSEVVRDRRSLTGPSEVQHRILLDRLSDDQLYELDFMQPYHKWKEQVLEKYNYAYALDYYSIFLKGSNGLEGTEDNASSGVVRFSGFWQLFGGAESTGTLIYLVEQRHKYSDNLPQTFALENAGYAGFFGIPFGNENGLHLTNLYWSQEWQNGFGFAVGFLDITDFVDIYAQTSPWTDFYNFVFSIGAATMDMPDDAALGLGGGGWLTDSVYLLAGINDLNSDPTDPFQGFDTFFNDSEYFKYAELGWSWSGKEQYYLDNIHLTMWHADEREEIGILDGWGGTLSYSQALDNKWSMFVRGGYAQDGGSLLQKSVSIGGGYAPAGISTPGAGHQLGFGVNWGQPNEDLFGSELDDQYAMEVYYRLQITKEFSITPDVQLLINPALNPDENTVFVFGLRARLAL